MTRTTLALIAISAALIGVVGGYFYGYDQGATAESAKRDGQAVEQLTGLIDSHQTLIDQSNTASAALRRAQTERAAAEMQFSKVFRDALKTSAAARAGCRFDDDSVRRLAAARDRAAAAAAGGSAATVPGAAAGPRP